MLRSPLPGRCEKWRLYIPTITVILALCLRGQTAEQGTIALSVADTSSSL
jgi:hypothetical protein